MKSSAVLPDTCAWIDYFRPKSPSDFGQVVERLLIESEVFICGPILYELTQGIRSDKERSKILDSIRALNYVEMTERLWLKAGDLSSALRKKGLTLPFSDILISAIAIQNNLSILTEDKHFNLIQGVELYKV